MLMLSSTTREPPTAGNPIFGDFLALLTALFYASYQLCMKRFRRDHSAPLLMFWASAVAALILFSTGLVSSGSILAGRGKSMGSADRIGGVIPRLRTRIDRLRNRWSAREPRHGDIVNSTGCNRVSRALDSWPTACAHADAWSCGCCRRIVLRDSRKGQSVNYLSQMGDACGQPCQVRDLTLLSLSINPVRSD